jgi:hypothetical protein
MVLTILFATEAGMTAIFGAPARAHFYATLTQLLQLPGKRGRASDDASASASFDAQAEGWDVFDCGLRDDGAPRIELQRLDSPACGTPLFRSHEGAWQHVVRYARAGSIPHQRALRMVDPVEWPAIKTKCGWCPGL